MRTRLILICFLFGLSPLVHGQTDSLSVDSNLTVDAKYEKDLKFMIESLQTMFNLLGDPGMSRQDKDQIIDQSYLKYFEDDKVQVEDDLDPSRNLPINKNIQSYLQDIVFFYKELRFTFEIRSFSKGLNDQDQLYYKADLSLRQEGVNLYGEEVQQIEDRYIEFNLNEEQQEFKIVSIYTTKLSEKEDLAAWWNELDQAWRVYFADSIQLNDSLSFDSLMAIKPDFNLLDTLIIEEDSLFIRGERMYADIKSLMAEKEIVLQASDSIHTLDPLEKFNTLKTLVLTDCPVDDISPIRSLLSLEELDISGSLISDLDDLNYLNELRVLKMNRTSIGDMTVATNWNSLEELYLANASLIDLAFLADLSGLKKLDLSGNKSINYSSLMSLNELQYLDLSSSNFDQLALINYLSSLHTLNLNNTPIFDLSVLSDSVDFASISLEETAIKDLMPLAVIKGLKVIYCDNSAVSTEAVQAFISKRQDVLVVYETNSLLSWWEALDDNLKSFIRSQMDSISEPPSTETLHTLIVTEEADLSGQKEITSLEGFQELINLKELNISGSGITDLSALSSLDLLHSLDLSNSQVSNIDALAGLPLLTDINMEASQVKSLDTLAACEELTRINANNTEIAESDILNFTRRTGVLVLYQNVHLIEWWETLDDEWSHFLSKKMDFNKNPKAEDLQDLVNADSLLMDQFSPSSLEAIVEFKILRKLKMERVKTSDLSPLRELNFLEDLSINNSNLGSYALIGEMKEIKRLDLSNTSLSDIEFLASMPQIEHLSIAGTAVENIKIMSALNRLESLDLSNTRVKKISYLNSILSLKQLKLTNTALNQRKIDSFKKQRPDVEIILY